MSRVNLEVMKPWISNRISELLGMEDDVLNEFVFNQLEANNVSFSLTLLFRTKSIVLYCIILCYCLIRAS